MRVVDREQGPTPAEVIAEHVALPEARNDERAFVRLNMVASADGGSAVDGRSGGLGNRDDHSVFAALREHAGAVLVGMGTAVAERYHAPTSGDLRIYVVATRPDISGNPSLFESDRVTLVLPDDAANAPDGVSVLRAGTGTVDLRRVLDALAGRVVMAEGGPTLAGRLSALGLVDEFFLTLSPRLIAGESSRVVHGPDADPALWNLHHCFVDDESFVFLRYARR